MHSYHELLLSAIFVCPSVALSSQETQSAAGLSSRMKGAGGVGGGWNQQGQSSGPPPPPGGQLKKIHSPFRDYKKQHWTHSQDHCLGLSLGIVRFILHYRNDSKCQESI